MGRTIGLIVCIFIAGCVPPKNATVLEDRPTENGWDVQRCFERDGYTVYRFREGYGDWRYYVIPQGEMIDHISKSDDDGTKTIPQSTRTVR